MYGSEKYMLHNLKDECSHYLQSSLDEECACFVLQTAHDLHLADLQTNAVKFILNNGEHCLESKSFISLSTDCLRLIIESDDLICKEEIIYQKIIEWSTNRCHDQNLPVNDENIRQVLGNSLYLVRFPIMERTYFTENVSKKSLLSSDEIINIYQSLDDRAIAVFPTRSRKVKYVVCIRCNTASSVEWTNDYLDFQTNTDFIMLGINVFGSNTYAGKHDIRLNVSKSYDVLSSINTVLYSKKGREIYTVMLDKPLFLSKNTRYTIQLNMKGPNTFTGESYKNYVSLDELSVTFLSSNIHSRQQTNENQVHIPGIIIQHIYQK